MIREELREHLETRILPFWAGLSDERFGGFYGHMDEELRLRKDADKGCILNSRILWTFSTAARVLNREKWQGPAEQAFRFFPRFEDGEHGGVYWSVTHDGKPADTTKHTYCQAFAIYGLAAYYRLTGEASALEKAKALFRIIENKCRDEKGYLEALKADFTPESNEKLSENGVMASRTMNTLLHVVEAYAELYRAWPDAAVHEAGRQALLQCMAQVYHPAKRRMEVFFDNDFHPLLDMQSYGHDIEGSWLLADAGGVFLKDGERGRLNAMCLDLLISAAERAWTAQGLDYECVNGEVNTIRAWWPQAEAMLGFAWGWRQTGDAAWLERLAQQWRYIQSAVVDPREGGEWLNEIQRDGTSLHKPVVEEWKCPYHNGRMCLMIVISALPDSI